MQAFLAGPRLWWSVLLLCLGALAAALVSQHAFDMQPCAWCVFQRLIFAAIAALAGLALLLKAPLMQKLVAALVAASAAGGVMAAIWQHNVAAQTDSCGFSLAERWVAKTGLDGLLPDVFAARASCADAAVKLWGLPYEFWSLTLFVLLMGAMSAVLVRSFMTRPPTSSP